MLFSNCACEVHIHNFTHNQRCNNIHDTGDMKSGACTTRICCHGPISSRKTLPKVLTHLHEGGFGAYFVASRACNRNGLCITEPVTLQDLNKPLPYNLCIKADHLATLEHNMYIHYGFREGSLCSVQDPESERHVKKTNFTTSFDVPDATQKRKCTGANKNSQASSNFKKNTGFRTPLWWLYMV